MWLQNYEIINGSPKTRSWTPYKKDAALIPDDITAAILLQGPEYATWLRWTSEEVR